MTNRDQPSHVPVKPMGNILVIVHLTWSDGTEEWRPARAIRWTASQVMVGWPDPDLGPARERWVWLPAGDVMRSMTFLVHPSPTPMSQTPVSAPIRVDL